MASALGMGCVVSSPVNGKVGVFQYGVGNPYRVTATMVYWVLQKPPFDGGICLKRMTWERR